MTSVPDAQPFATDHAHSVSCRWDPPTAQWVCGSAVAESEAGTRGGPHDRPLVDTRDMLVVHTAMLREFRLAPAAVRRTRTGDQRRARDLAVHLAFLGDLLHHHHQGEDDLLWPTLRERTPSAAHELIDEVEAQHEEIDVALEEVTASRLAWAADPDSARRDLLADRLERLSTLLRGHLDLEERALLPLAAMVLTRSEWLAIGEAGAASIPRRLLPLTFGMFAYEGDPDVISGMLAAAPLIPRTLLPLIAPRVYARRARAVHGTSRP